MGVSRLRFGFGGLGLQHKARVGVSKSLSYFCLVRIVL